MQTHHDAAPARPTADWIHHYAADLLAAAPGMHPLDAVRQALEVTEGAAEPGRESTLARAGEPSPAWRGEP